MQAATTTCHAAAIGPRRPSRPYHYFCSPPLWPLHEYKDSLKRINRGIEIVKVSRLTARANAKAKSEWGLGPYEVFENGQKYFLDEQDVVSFLDPPKELIPLDPSSYNPASYLWKKIEDIPEERRHNLLSLLNSRLISRTWEVAGGRYGDPKLVSKISSGLLPGGDHAGSLEMWKCQTSGAPLPISWINNSRKVIFCCTDGKAYGRFIDGNPFSGIINSYSPLYFSVTQVNEVMSTEQPCDFAYEFGDGLLNLPEYPQDFPKPAKHPWPFNDHVVIYVRHVGPGVLVGQAWQEGKALQQVPKKLCGEMLMVKDYFDVSHNN